MNNLHTCTAHFAIMISSLLNMQVKKKKFKKTSRERGRRERKVGRDREGGREIGREGGREESEEERERGERVMASLAACT